MDLKIICPCGAHFAFEVEPENGQMPVPVACPSCGADATPSANDQIRATLETNAAPSRPPTPPAAAPARAPLRVGGGPTTADAVAEDAAPTPDSPLQRCAKHATEVAVAECAVCGKPICQLCLDQFGFLCSVYCRQQAEDRSITVPAYGATKRHARQRQRHKELRILAAIPACLALLVALWAYYFFYASRPRPTWSLAAPAGKRFAHALWLNNDRVLALNRERLVLLDASNGQPLWSTSLKAEESPLDDASTGPPLQVGREAAWVVFASRVVRFQLSDGQRKGDIPLPGTVEHFSLTEGALAVTSSLAPDREAFTWIDLASGQPRTETFARPVVRENLLDALAADEGQPATARSSPSTEVIATARGAARVSTRVLQQEFAGVNTPGQRDRPSVIERETLRAGDSEAAGAEFMRNTAELRRLDVSRCTASVRWFAANPGPEWKSETIGRPCLFPLATVNVLIAGTNAVVFGASGEKRWETRLAYPVGDRFIAEQPRFPAGPCRESANRLYLADLVNLTAFDLNNGQILWRVQAVGIRDIQSAPGGGVYITATTAGPQAIAYVNPKDADAAVQPLLLRLDAAGKILWQQTGLGERCFPSGKFLYVTRTQSSMLDEFKASVDGGEAPRHFRVHRVDPKDGRLLWEYYQLRPPLITAPNRNRFFLLFRDELQMVRFTSL